MPRFSVVQKIGVGLLAVAFVPTLFTLIVVRRSHARPLEFSVALHSDRNRLPEFKTESPGVYKLSLRLNRTGMDPERQDCLLGIQKSTLQPCKILPVANFLYTVWNEIGIVETGQAGQDWEKIPGKDIALVFGYLKAKRGVRYRWEVLFYGSERIKLMQPDVHSPTAD